MGLELAKTLDLVKLGLTDPAAAWQKYFSEEMRWQDTALLLTGPLVVPYALLVAAFTAMFGGFGGLVPGGGFWGMLISTLLGALVGLFVGSLVFSFLAGKMGGQSSFNNAFAALSLAWVPAVLGGVAGAIIPFVGPLLALAGAVLSLVYLYRLLPLALALPDSKRVLHFVLGLVAIVIINIVVGSIFGLGSRGNITQPDVESYSGSHENAARGSGMVGAMQRYGEIVETAGTHTYTPPADGKLSKSQMNSYVDVQRKASKVQARFQEKMQDMEKALENQEKPSLAGLSALGSTISGAVGAQNAEMEIVVTGQGNWAEYSWVKSQVQTALLHGGEGGDAIVHNYKLIQPFLEDLQI